MTTGIFTGSIGMTHFNETVEQAEAASQILSPTQKRQLAAVKRKAIKQDLLGD